MTEKKSYNQKSWWWNMNNIVINYHHCGEENDLYLVHMNHKCRIDRKCVESKVWKWR